MKDDLDFGILLALAYSGFVGEMRASLADSGHDHLNRSFGYVARAIADTPLTLSELAERLDVTSQGALKIVDDMEENGYLERVRDPKDGRAKRLRLTKRGKATLAAARAFHRRFEAALSARLGKREVATCRAVLEGIIERGIESGKSPSLRSM